MEYATFITGKNGSVISRDFGKIAFPERRGPQPVAGETYEVLEQRDNGNVLLLRLGKKISEIIVPGVILFCRSGKWSIKDRQSGEAAEYQAAKALSAQVGQTVPYYLVKYPDFVQSSEPVEDGWYKVTAHFIPEFSRGSIYGASLSRVDVLEQVLSLEEHEARIEAARQARIEAKQAEKRARLHGLTVAELDDLRESILCQYNIAENDFRICFENLNYMPLPEYLKKYTKFWYAESVSSYEKMFARED